MKAGERFELLLYGYNLLSPSSFLYARRFLYAVSKEQQAVYRYHQQSTINGSLYKKGVLGRYMNCASLPPLLTPNSSLLTI